MDKAPHVSDLDLADLFSAYQEDARAWQDDDQGETYLPDALPPALSHSINRNDSVAFGSAGVSPAVFGVPPKTLTRRTRAQFGEVSDASNPPAGRRRERPGRSRSSFSTESFRINRRSHFEVLLFSEVNLHNPIP